MDYKVNHKTIILGNTDGGTIDLKGDVSLPDIVHGSAEDDVLTISNGSITKVPRSEFSIEFRRTFLIPAGTLANLGGNNGVLNLVGFTNEQGDQLIPDKPNQDVYDGSSDAKYVWPDKIIRGLSTDDDGYTLNDVLVVLNGVDPVAPVTGNFTNFSNVSANYQIDGGSFESIASMATVSFPMTGNIIIQLSSTPENPCNLFDQSFNNLMNTDSDFFVETTPHQWTIPSGTTELSIRYAV